PSAIPYERDIARDLARRAVIAAPFAVAFGALVQGWAGAVGVALGLAVVVFNYLVAGVAQSWAASKDSPGFFGATALVSLIFRFVVVIVALSLLRDRPFIDYATFGITLVVSHVGLLAWEAKSVHLTLAFPGLKPGKD